MAETARHSPRRGRPTQCPEPATPRGKGAGASDEPQFHQPVSGKDVPVATYGGEQPHEHPDPGIDRRLREQRSDPVAVGESAPESSTQVSGPQPGVHILTPDRL